MVVANTSFCPARVEVENHYHISANLFALLQLTKGVVKYAKQTKDAPRERAEVLREASSLVGLLGTLKDLLDEGDPQDPWLRATSGLALPDGPLEQYKLALERLAPKIIPSHGLQKVSQVLTWMFSKEEVGELLSKMERVKTLVGIALEMDHMSVL
jgi:hypothetical protein